MTENFTFNYISGPIPTGWERNGKIEMENLTVQQEPGTLPILNNINLAINPGEKVCS